jgi:hypothetical protein
MNCPHCKNSEFNGKHCRFCGCKAEINEKSGNILYMIRGRIVAAPDDLREQHAKYDGRFSIKGPDPMDLRDQRAEKDD